MIVCVNEEPNVGRESVTTFILDTSKLDINHPLDKIYLDAINTAVDDDGTAEIPYSAALCCGESHPAPNHLRKAIITERPTPPVDKIVTIFYD